MEKKTNKVKKNKVKQSKQSTIKQTSEEVRRIIDSYHNLRSSMVSIMLRYLSGGPSSCSQVEIEQIKVRLKELDTALSQMSSSPSSQRKLLRLKNSADKRNGVERVHTKSKARNSKNRHGVLRTKPTKAKHIIKANKK